MKYVYYMAIKTNEIKLLKLLPTTLYKKTITIKL